MNNIFKYFVLSILLSNCSLDTKSGIWTDKENLKEDIKINTVKTFKAGCNIALHCNGNFNEMEIVANNSPLINAFIIKKTSQFYKILS